MTDFTGDPPGIAFEAYISLLRLSLNSIFLLFNCLRQLSPQGI